MMKNAHSAASARHARENHAAHSSSCATSSLPGALREWRSMWHSLCKRNCLRSTHLRQGGWRRQSEGMHLHAVTDSANVGLTHACNSTAAPPLLSSAPAGTMRTV